MMKNIFVSDIDGTLTDSCSPSLDIYGIKALQRASKLGEVILASGRPFKGIRSMYSYEDLNIDYIVALNGAHILYKNKTFRTYPISRNIIDYFLSVQHQYLNIWFYTKNDWYASSLETEAYSKEVKGVNHHALPLSDYKLQDVLKILVVEEKKIQNVVCNFKNIFSGVNISTSSNTYIEIFSSRINKYIAVKEIFKNSDVRIFSFGDSYNDLEMIKNSFFGCAVSNAVLLLKKTANYISSYKHGRGVYDSLNHIEKNFFN
jgi:Cof subfamily protein (haloacid dehalogenase superfamily)